MHCKRFVAFFISDVWVINSCQWEIERDVFNGIFINELTLQFLGKWSLELCFGVWEISVIWL